MIVPGTIYGKLRDLRNLHLYVSIYFFKTIMMHVWCNWLCGESSQAKIHLHDFCNTNLLSHFRILQTLCSEKLYILYDFLAWLDYMNCTKVIVHLGSVKMDVKFLKCLRFLVMLLVGSPFFGKCVKFLKILYTYK